MLDAFGVFSDRFGTFLHRAELSFCASLDEKDGLFRLRLVRILAEAIRIETTLWIGALFHLNGIASNALKAVSSYDLDGTALVSALLPRTILAKQAFRSGTIAHKTNRSAHTPQTELAYGSHRRHDIHPFLSS